MKKRAIAVILAGILLTGCSLQTAQGNKSKQALTFQNVYDLDLEEAYVWQDKGYGDLAKDLDKDRTGREAFFKTPKGTISFAGKELDETDAGPRNIWFEEGEDESIPTVTKKDALLYVSDTKVPGTIVFERFADAGYSIGIAALKEDEGGHFYIPYAEDKDDDYKYYIDPKSKAAELTEFSGIERLYLDKVGDAKVTKENVTDGGVVSGLMKDKSYECQFYTGTFYQDYELEANVRTFTSLERFESHEYEFLHANCIKLKIPEYFKSGYYMVLGKGLIRYVSPEDEESFKAGVQAIDWNDPIKRYDEYGLCIYDPSTDTGTETEEGDEGLTDEEVTETTK